MIINELKLGQFFQCKLMKNNNKKKNTRSRLLVLFYSDPERCSFNTHGCHSEATCFDKELPVAEGESKYNLKLLAKEYFEKQKSHFSSCAFNQKFRERSVPKGLISHLEAVGCECNSPLTGDGYFCSMCPSNDECWTYNATTHDCSMKPRNECYILINEK